MGLIPLAEDCREVKRTICLFSGSELACVKDEQAITVRRFLAPRMNGQFTISSPIPDNPRSQPPDI